MGGHHLLQVLLLVALVYCCDARRSTSTLATTLVTDDGRNFTSVDDKLPPEITTCEKLHCSHKCVEEKGKTPYCACPDERMYLGPDGKNCAAKTCKRDNPNEQYNCGKSNCEMRFDVFERRTLARCTCVNYGKLNEKYLLQGDECVRDPSYKTCDWPLKNGGCDQGCRVVYSLRGTATDPQCTCKPGYGLDSTRKNCIVTNACLIDDLNGGCDHKCSYNSKTQVTTCSCHDTHTLNQDGKTCDIISCDNGNTGCEQGCTQYDNRNFYCFCKKGFHLNPDGKTCLDYDECSGFHGCDQKCVNDGNHFYKCDCDDGYYLADNGFSCRVSEKCINHDCGQHCHPTTGQCYCDPTHKLAADGKTCLDVDECQMGTDNCQEICINHDGGFTCACNDPKARLSNDLKTCILDTCANIPDIQFGKTVCTKGHTDDDTKVGDYCHFTCSPGRKLVGAAQVRCTQSGWDFIPPHCADINECMDKTICGQHETCVNTDGSYKCVCDTGYQKSADGSCADNVGPKIITCPQDQTKNLPSDSDSVTFTWVKPRVFDPTDATLNCIDCPDKEQRAINVGSVTIRYLYSDRAGSKALCSFKLKAVDATPPVFSGCNNNTVYNRGPGTYAMKEFAQITATDNSGKVTLTSDKPASFKNAGITTVNYLAKDPSGNTASCTFSVNITTNECPALAPPKNGYHGCDDWHVGTFCKPICNAGFAFFTQPPSFHCGDDGAWTPAEPLPDCYSVAQPEEAALQFVSTYRTSMCPKDDPAQLASVVGITKNSFDTAKSTFCFADLTCKLSVDPQVECHDDYFTVSISTTEGYANIPDHDNMLIDFKTKVKARKEQVATFMNLFIPPVTMLAPAADQNGLPVTPMFKLSCGKGTDRVGNQCVTCPAGQC